MTTPDPSKLLQLVAAFTAEDGPMCARVSNEMTVREIGHCLISLQAMESALKLVLEARGFEFDSRLAERNIQTFVDEKLGRNKAS
jgi:hypothetical protein